MRKSEIIKSQYRNIEAGTTTHGLIEILIYNQKLMLEILMDIRDKT